jgi:hypothetical protein
MNRTTMFHNHERKLVKDNLNSYLKQIEGLEQAKNITCPLYNQLKGKAELCGELLG